jgi:hypothetical protein
MKLPDFDRMLPGAAWEALVEHLVVRLEAASLNSYLDPIYDYTHACQEVDRDGSEWVRRNLFEALIEARKRYEQRHPAGWDNEKQQSYREGIKSRW